MDVCFHTELQFANVMQLVFIVGLVQISSKHI